jgi:adenine-specific DNA-methyltransferase
MNGLYFKPFRYWLLDRVALTHIHVFDRRDKAFADDDVLQENVILRMIVGAEQGEVAVSVSDDHRFADVRQRVCSFAEVVTPADDERFIHVPTVGSPSSDGLPGVPLRDQGLDVCTGPVVDFRLRDHLRQVPEPGTVPLLYASHFSGGRFEWPREGRKPNAIARNPKTEKWLMPQGCYVILRRFSSKEERRRVVAYLLEESATPGDMIGFENHLNVIHQDRRGLPPAVARGLVKYLNSQAVDDYFRMFSGHTQVNATDLRRLRYPTLEELEEMGKSAVASEDRGSAARPD